MANMQRGMTRLSIVLAVLWVLGMGWYQYDEAQHTKDNSITLSLSKDSELRIDASGIKQEDRSALETKRFAIVFIPALLLLLIGPVGGWLAGGFKKEGQG